jgi:hypothetical protein
MAAAVTRPTGAVLGCVPHAPHGTRRPHHRKGH